VHCSKFLSDQLIIVRQRYNAFLICQHFSEIFFINFKTLTFGIILGIIFAQSKIHLLTN
jgi:hypothetical protein